MIDFSVVLRMDTQGSSSVAAREGEASSEEEEGDPFLPGFPTFENYSKVTLYNN